MTARGIVVIAIAISKASKDLTEEIGKGPSPSTWMPAEAIISGRLFQMADDLIHIAKSLADRARELEP